MRVALGSVAPVPMLMESLSEIAPIDDVRSTARYRMQVVKNLMEEFLYVYFVAAASSSMALVRPAAH